MKRSLFDLSFYKMFDCNQGQLIPQGWFEVLPGDSIQHATSLLIRTQPLVAPVMHPVHVRVHNWFVPYRILWEDWESFITGGADPDSPPTFPYITINNAALNSLADYLGVPTGVAQNVTVSALPFRAYARIFNENYRDQDLVSMVGDIVEAGEDTDTNTTLQNVAWEKDYFTAARPWAQKGDAVTLPLGTTAPIVTNNEKFKFSNSVDPEFTMEGIVGGASVKSSGANFGSAAAFEWGTETGLEADLATATGATINDIRLAMALQRYQEARARYGSRYTEYLRYLGVRSSDARLQRPEYLGGSKATIQFSEVLQTGVTTSGNTLGVGNLRGHGIGTTRSNRYRRYFEEHGIVMSLLSVKPKTVYFEGLHKAWKRFAREDHWQKELEHIGQEEIYKREIYMQGTSADAEVWGYQDRYDTYRRNENSIAGNFKNTLNSWHLARDFSGLPTLNATFVTADPTNRVYAVTSDPQLYVMAHQSIQARRLLTGNAAPKIY